MPVYRRHRKSIQEEHSGSPAAGEPEYLVIGRLRRSHGLAGEMTMDVLTDFPERITPGKVVQVGEARAALTIRSVRPKNKEMLVAFEGIHDPDSANHLRNQLVFVRVDELPPLPEGEYYFHQLLGLRVLDQNGNLVGTLVEIIETGANDVYLIRNETTQNEMMLPAVDDFVLRIDLAERVIIVSPPEYQ